MKNHKHATIVSANFNRELFTSHGLHMDDQGKAMIAKQIVATSSAVFHKESVVHIPIYWIDNYDDIANNESLTNAESEGKQSDSIDHSNEAIRMSKTQETPSYKKNDFFNGRSFSGTGKMG
jgi:hypothetical protein